MNFRERLRQYFRDRLYVLTRPSRRDHRGVNRMYCYVCFIETGCDSSPALAICQRCGAGICRAHLVESTMAPGLAQGEKPGLF